MGFMHFNVLLGAGDDEHGRPHGDGSTGSNGLQMLTLTVVSRYWNTKYEARNAKIENIQLKRS